MASFLDSIQNIFSGAHKGSVLGIDIGSSSIKVVVVEKVDEKAILKNYGEIPLGPRANVASGQATNLSPDEIAKALRDLLHEAGIATRHTVIAIPFQASLISMVELPDVPQKDLDSMVPLEARRYIPVPINEVSLDWWVLPKKRNEKTVATVSTEEHPQVPQRVSSSTSTTEEKSAIGKVEVIIAAIHNEVIKKYQTIQQVAQIPGEGAHFEIEIFSTLRAVVGRDLAPTMVIDIGAGSMKLAIVDEGVVRGSHVVAVGGQDITLGLSRAQNIPFARAEEMKCRTGMIGDMEGRDVRAIGELLITNAMNEAARFADVYSTKHNTKIEKVILVGGGALLKGIEAVAKQSFPNANVALGDPFARVDAPAFLAPTLKELSPRFAVALGVALKGLEE